MKVGDLVKRTFAASSPIADDEELGVGVVIDIESRDYYNVTNIDFVVMWPKHGVSWEWADALEVISESR
jgi:hypothetical protein